MATPVKKILVGCEYDGYFIVFYDKEGKEVNRFTWDHDEPYGEGLAKVFRELGFDAREEEVY